MGKILLNSIYIFSLFECVIYFLSHIQPERIVDTTKLIDFFEKYAMLSVLAASCIHTVAHLQGGFAVCSVLLLSSSSPLLLFHFLLFFLFRSLFARTHAYIVMIPIYTLYFGIEQQIYGTHTTPRQHFQVVSIFNQKPSSSFVVYDQFTYMKGIHRGFRCRRCRRY